MWQQKQRNKRAQRTFILAFGWVCFAMTLTILAVAATYSPALHWLLGDGGYYKPEFFKVKVVDENAAALSNLLHAKEPPVDGRVPRLDLYVEKNAFDTLNHQIVLYGLGKYEKKPRVDGWLKTPSGLKEVKVAMRGTNEWHHKYWKPSLRLRLDKNDLLDGMRNHILVSPEDGIAMRNWLSDKIATDLGVLTPREHFVHLFINKRSFGLYNRMWRLDESLLIKTDRLPGPFFRLESRTGPVYRRIIRGFTEPKDWEFKGIELEAGRETIKRFLIALIESDNIQESRAKVDRVLDHEAMINFLIALTMAGSTHVETHNVAFWLNTTTGKMEPVIMDAMGYGTNDEVDQENVPIVLPNSVFIRRWLEYPENLNAYVDRLYTYIQNEGSAKEHLKMVMNKWQEIKPVLESDVYYSGIGFSDKMATRSLFRLSHLERNLKALKLFITEREGAIKNQIKFVKLALTEKMENSFEIFLGGAAGAVVERKDGKPFELFGRKRKRATLSTAVYKPGMTHKFVPPYAFHKLPGQPADYIFHNRVTKEPVPWDKAPTELPKFRELVGRVYDVDKVKKPHHYVEVGPGKVVWEGFRAFPANSTLTIKPGTTIEMGPKATVIIQGQLQVEGTKAAPVKVLRKDPKQAFGVWALLGDGCEGSTIKHMDFGGGSTFSSLNIYFSGMFSVRNCPSIEILDSTFSFNEVGDDTVHIVESPFLIKRSTFKDSNMDALDVDRADGKILDSKFTNPGNDGLDLSMADVEVRSTEFADAKDKCLSVGEGTKLKVYDSNFSKCHIGVAVKDSAQASIYSSRFVECDTAISNYRKKWRWTVGGSSWVYGSQFVDSKSFDLAGDKHSKFYIDPENINTVRYRKDTKISVVGRLDDKRGSYGRSH